MGAGVFVYYFKANVTVIVSETTGTVREIQPIKAHR